MYYIRRKYKNYLMSRVVTHTDFGMGGPDGGTCIHGGGACWVTLMPFVVYYNYPEIYRVSKKKKGLVNAAVFALLPS